MDKEKEKEEEEHAELTSGRRSPFRREKTAEIFEDFAAAQI
jgi:hypothetical protein